MLNNDAQGRVKKMVRYNSKEKNTSPQNTLIDSRQDHQFLALMLNEGQDEPSL